MNKDAVLATIIGFGVGLVIAGAVFLGPGLIKNIRIPSLNLSFLSSVLPKSSGKKAKPTPTPVAKTFSIESPLPDSIEPKSESLISGAAIPGAIIVLEGESDEAVAVATDKGAYAAKLSLGEGKNDIVVTSYAGKTVESKTLTVYYTPEDF